MFSPIGKIPFNSTPDPSHALPLLYSKCNVKWFQIMNEALKTTLSLDSDGPPPLSGLDLFVIEL